jgi:flagellar P-ring protein precursor FlgI
MTFLALFLFLLPDATAARVKDIAEIYGVRNNMISGVGLVTGLNRTGDTIQNEVTVQMLMRRLQGQGISVPMDAFRARNVAVVMVNAWLPSSSRPGQRIEVEVSATGDSISLAGGVLQPTPLLALDRTVYAIAQGSVVVGGFTVEQGGNISRKNHTTVGRIPSGASVERENPNRVDFSETTTLDWLLKNPDFTTARRLAEVVNVTVGDEIAKALDAGAVQVRIPDDYVGRTVEFIALVEALDVSPDAGARVVINERTGTVVMGDSVRIAPVAVAHGGMSIEIRRSNDASQPGLLSGGQTAVTTNDTIEISEEEGQLKMIEGVTVGALVASLNQMGVTPRDLVQILVSIQTAGALHAELVVN